jgi:hypothetical protein
MSGEVSPALLYSPSETLLNPVDPLAGRSLGSVSLPPSLARHPRSCSPISPDHTEQRHARRDPLQQHPQAPLLLQLGHAAVVLGSAPRPHRRRPHSTPGSPTLVLQQQQRRHRRVRRSQLFKQQQQDPRVPLAHQTQRKSEAQLVARKGNHPLQARRDRDPQTAPETPQGRRRPPRHFCQTRLDRERLLVRSRRRRPRYALRPPFPYLPS